MKIVKGSQGGGRVALGEEDLARINALARRALEEGEVYTFSVRLCDNEVDRDLERFSRETLEELAGLFVGKSGIFDHQWSAQGQTARIYKTEVVHEPERATRAGEPYCWLKGYAYMMRTDKTKDLIAEIEGGIKKEVSVGCAVEAVRCSICGGDLKSCGHKKGQEYEGKLCFASLEGAADAFEFSFVAVPAQPLAGVVKGMERQAACLKELVRGDPVLALELEQLEEEARMGRTYRKELCQEVVRLGLLAGMGLEEEVLSGMAEKLSREELLAAKAAWGKKAGERYPLKPQLDYGKDRPARDDRDQAFLI